MENNITSLVTSLVADYFSDPENSGSSEKWISDKLNEALPELGKESSAAIGKSIINTINSVNSNIAAVDKAIAEGGTRESYLIEAVDSTLPDSSMGTRAKILAGCAGALANAAGEMDNGGLFNINGEMKDFEEMWKEDNWNEYKVSDLASNVAQQAGAAALKTLSENIMSGVEESIQSGVELGNDVLCSEVGSAADVGIKTAAAGALQIAYKKGYLDELMPFEVTPSSLANIAVGAVEDVKTIASVAAGDLSVEEGLDRVQRTGVARVVNFIAENGEAAGAFIGGLFGPQGIAVGRVVGKAISYCAKTEAKQAMIDAGNAICDCARACFTTVKNAAVSAWNTVKNGILSLFA